MKPRPWLVVTEDGKRPWHRKFRVRYLEQGRVAYWWGQYKDIGKSERGPHTRVAALWTKLRKHGQRTILRAKLMELREGLIPASYFWPSRAGSLHLGACDATGYIGIAWLPDNPWPPLTVWPGWRHLAHGDECEQKFAALETLTDEELVTLLDTPPEGA